MSTSNFIQELQVAYEKRFHLSRLGELLGSFRKKADDAIVKLGKEPLPPNDPARRKFGLLTPLDLGTREVAHTRILAWLMNPKGSHGLESALLKELLEWCVIKKNLDPSHYAPTPNIVQAEYRFAPGEKSRKKYGRADVFLQAAASDVGKAWILVIEAKINAPESEEQCADYDRWLKEYVKKWGQVEMFRIFLSPDGRKPSSGCKSADNWSPMSYLKLAHILRKIWESKVSLCSANEVADYLSLYINSVLFDIVGYQRKDFAPETYNPFVVLEYLDH